MNHCVNDAASVSPAPSSSSQGFSPLNPGDRFGDFVVERLLGRGGMGVVYLVRSPDGAPLAVKVMHAGAMSHDLRVRFAREAEFAMKIRHPNLISVYDVGEDPDSGLCYIVMDYVPGGTLTDKLRESGRIPVAKAIWIAQKIAVALEVAHRNGIVHRDVKPDNIMFDEDGTPKLADLGVARFDEEQRTMVTMTGMMIGTPAYMSPEQMIDSHKTDARSDIYSLGVVLYEMLSGKRPNSDSTAVELLAKAIKGEELPDIRTMCPEVSAAVAHVLSLMCASEPGKRPATSMEAAQLLQKAVTGKLLVLPKKVPKASDAASRKTKRTMLPAAFALAAGMAALAVAAVFFRRDFTDVPPKTAAAVATNVVEKVVLETNVVEKVVVATNVVDMSAEKSSSSIKLYSAKVGDYTWYYALENGNAVITRGDGGYSSASMAAVSPLPEGRVEVPAVIDGHKVTAIGGHAFFECEKMTEVVLPEGLKEICGWGAFYRCISLKKLVVPSSLERFCGISAVLFCTNLAEVDLANCRYFEGCSVNGCRNCRFKVSPDNPVYTVKDGAVYSKDMRKLIRWPESNGDLVIPESVREIGGWACHRCPAKEIVFRGPVSKIGQQAFSNMNSLTNAVLPEGVQFINGGMFFYCKELDSVTFPASVQQIGGAVFLKCMKLRTVNMLGSAPIVRSGFLSKTDESLTVVVPKGSTGWLGPGISGLPEKWPLGGEGEARRIVYSDSPPPSSGLGVVAKAQEVGDLQKQPVTKDDLKVRLAGVAVCDAKTGESGKPDAPYVSKSSLHANYRSLDRNRVFVEVCHAHDCYKTPPHTLDRVKEAISMKADILFMSLACTKDGVLFSAERENLEEISNGTGSVGDHTARQMRNFKVKQNGGLTTKGFAALEDMLKIGKGKILFKISGAYDYAEELERLLDRLDAWESVILETWGSVGEMREKFGEAIWRRIRTGEVQIMVVDVSSFWAFRNVAPECSVWGWHINLDANGIRNIPQRIDVGFVYGPGEANRTDDELGWKRALDDGATVFRTNLPVELGRFLKKRGRRK